MIEKEETRAGQPDKADVSGDGDGSRTKPQIDTQELDSPRVVYRRPETTETSTSSPISILPAKSIWAREISPAIMPLVIGFLVLLILIAVLGVLSMRRMNEVGVAVLDLEQQHAAKFSLLLKLRLAVTKLDNEARARSEADARRELKPPFDFRLSTAREEMKELLSQLEHPPLA